MTTLVCLKSIWMLFLFADSSFNRRRSSLEWPTTVWRRWSTGRRSRLRPSAKPALREESLPLSLDQVCSSPLELTESQGSRGRLVSKMLPPIVDRHRQSGGHCHWPPWTDPLLDGLCDRSHRGGLSGWLSASRHRRHWPCQPPGHYHRPQQWVCVFSLVKLLMLHFSDWCFQ